MDTAIYTTLISLFGGGMLASLLFVARLLNARLGDMSIRLGDMEGQIHRLSDKIDANRIELSEKIEANGREISKLVTRTAVIETRLGSIEAHLGFPTPNEPSTDPEPTPTTRPHP